MKSWFGVLFLSVCALSGCYGTAKLYPVQGPLSEQVPVPIFSAHMSGFQSGNITVVLSNGEVCKGRWQMVPSGATNNNTMVSEWDSVYGQGFYVAHVLGKRLYVRATLTGNQGTILKAEMYRRDTSDKNDIDLDDAKGVAKDDKGNLYKIVFTAIV